MGVCGNGHCGAGAGASSSDQKGTMSILAIVPITTIDGCHNNLHDCAVLSVIMKWE